MQSTKTENKSLQDCKSDIPQIPHQENSSKPKGQGDINNDAPIIIQDRRIRSVNLSHREMVASIYIKQWEAIPNFAIITGKNGSGKTLLLECLKTLADEKEKLNIVYKSSMDQGHSPHDWSSSNINTYIILFPENNITDIQVKETC